ncbi:MAG TPA: hypothetical protein VNX25_10505, partial [Verrucomicrobiae bacterium]|nr:hypothetical protein [Verrucomicrobiae bacterium]
MRKGTAASLAVTLLVAGAASATYSRTLVWQKNSTLFRDCLEKNPDFGPAKNELARALLT